MTASLLLGAFIAWMTANSDLPRPDVRPIIEVKTPEELWHMYLPGREFPEDPDDGRVHGLYIAGTIYISSNCPLSDLFCQSVILHELVHAYQEQMDEVECLGRLEAEAYRLQKQWLEERGISIWDHLDPLYTMMVMQAGCGPEFLGEAPR